MKQHIVLPILTASATLLLFVFTGCKTPPEAVEASIEELTPKIAAEKEPEALDIDWTGTSWIIPDTEESSVSSVSGRSAAKTYPGYRGFHLGENGRLFLLNFNGSIGAEWEVSGNRMELSLQDGFRDKAWNGRFIIYPEGPDIGEAIRLVPDYHSGSTDTVSDGSSSDLADILSNSPLKRARPRVDLVENHWIPRRLAGGEDVVWPMNREIHLMLLPDADGGMGIIGYGGVNRFRATINYDSQKFLVAAIAITRRYGPAIDFENLYVRHIDEATDYVQVKDDLFLYRGNEAVATFQVRLFD